jgi:hypothetical protein
MPSVRILTYVCVPLALILFIYNLHSYPTLVGHASGARFFSHDRRRHSRKTAAIRAMNQLRRRTKDAVDDDHEAAAVLAQADDSTEVRVREMRAGHKATRHHRPRSWPLRSRAMHSLTVPLCICAKCTRCVEAHWPAIAMTA